MFRGKQNSDFKCFQLHVDQNDKYSIFDCKFDCDLFKSFVFNYFGMPKIPWGGRLGYSDEKVIRVYLKLELIHYASSNGFGINLNFYHDNVFDWPEMTPSAIIAYNYELDCECRYLEKKNEPIFIIFGHLHIHDLEEW